MESAGISQEDLDEQVEAGEQELWDVRGKGDWRWYRAQSNNCSDYTIAGIRALTGETRPLGNFTPGAMIDWWDKMYDSDGERLPPDPVYEELERARNDPRPRGLCFLAGTMIATHSGEKPIQDISVGDTVIALAGGADEQEMCQVVSVFRYEYSEAIYHVTCRKNGNDEQLGVTSEHPFWVVSGTRLSERPDPIHLDDDSIQFWRRPMGFCTTSCYWRPPFDIGWRGI